MKNEKYEYKPQQIRLHQLAQLLRQVRQVLSLQ
jgi:hypothetical protein